MNPQWIAWAAALVLTIELIHRLKVFRTFRYLAETSSGAGKVLFRKASDHWKQRASALHARRLLCASLRAAGLLILAALPLLLVVAYHIIQQGSVSGGVGVIRGLWSAALVGVGYAVMRRRFRHES